MVTSNGINDCSIVLFVIAERVHSAKRYRNAFEVIRQKVIDRISEDPERRRRETVHGLTQELVAPSSYASQPSMPFEVNEGGYEEFSRIIRDMTGEDFLSAPFATAPGNEPVSQGIEPNSMGLGYEPSPSDLFKFTDIDYGS